MMYIRFELSYMYNIFETESDYIGRGHIQNYR